MDNQERNLKGKSSLLCSTRLSLFIVFVLATFNFMLQRLVINFALVCMVPNPNFENENSTMQVEGHNSSTALWEVCQYHHHALTTVNTSDNVTDFVLREPEFTWSKEVQGGIIAALYYGFTIILIPAGWICDRCKVSRLFIACGTIYSILTLMNPIAAKWGPNYMIAIRFFQGMTHGTFMPSINVLAARWSGSSERGFLLSIAYAGYALGSAVIYPVAAFACETFGWEYTFYITGLTGLLWSLMAYLILYDWPETHPRISEGELQFIQMNRAVTYGGKGVKTDARVPWKHIFTSLPVLAVFIANLCCMWSFQTVVLYLPLFLKEALNADISNNGFFSSLPFIAMLIAHFPAAILFDWIRKKDCMGLTTLRKCFNTIGMVIPAIAMYCLGFIPPSKDPCDTHSTMISAITLICVALAFSEFAYMGGYLFSVFELAPRFAGMLTGLMSTSGLVPGFLVPPLVTILTHEDINPRDGWLHVFYVTACFNLCGAGVYLLFGRAEAQTWAEVRRRSILEPKKELSAFVDKNRDEEK